MGVKSAFRALEVWTTPAEPNEPEKRRLGETPSAFWEWELVRLLELEGDGHTIYWACGFAGRAFLFAERFIRLEGRLLV